MFEYDVSIRANGCGGFGLAASVGGGALAGAFFIPVNNADKSSKIL